MKSILLTFLLLADLLQSASASVPSNDPGDVIITTIENKISEDKRERSLPFISGTFFNNTILLSLHHVGLCDITIMDNDGNTIVERPSIDTSSITYVNIDIPMSLLHGLIHIESDQYFISGAFGQ